MKIIQARFQPAQVKKFLKVARKVLREEEDEAGIHIVFQSLCLFDLFGYVGKHVSGSHSCDP